MLKSEFLELTGKNYISQRAFEKFIEPAYMEFDGTKQEFCEIIKPCIKGFEALAEAERMKSDERHDIKHYFFTYAEFVEKIAELEKQAQNTNFSDYAEYCKELADEIRAGLRYIY